MLWTALYFGEHIDMTLPQVIFSDPCWFFWAMSKNVFRDKGLLELEADDLFYKATHIRIPNNDDGILVVEYFLHPPADKFAYFNIIPIDRSAHTGSSRTFRRYVIDMSVPWDKGGYDKLGYKSFLKSLKIHVFGKESARLTKQFAEKYFNYQRNFA